MGRSRVNQELGMISVAFPPQYETRERFYVSYHDHAGSNTVSRFATSIANPNLADPNSEQLIMSLREPIRFSVDRLNGDLFIGDAGQAVGEVNHLPAEVGGLNLGWSLVEAETILHPELDLNLNEFTGPVATHEGPGRIVGGFMYRGHDAPRMNDTYFFGDERFGTVWGLRNVDGTWEKSHLANPTYQGPLFLGGLPPPMLPFKITAFGEDEAGRLYVANYGTNMWWQDSQIGTPYLINFGAGIYLLEDDLLAFSLRSELDQKGMLRLMWQSAPGMMYRLQFSKDMVRWSNFHRELRGTGAVLAVVNIPVSKTERFFFRVAVRPSD